MNDLKFAFRQLLKNPGFTAVAVLTLALGIGANTAIFSLIDTVLIRPLPYRDAEQLLDLAEVTPAGQRNRVSGGAFKDWAEQDRLLSDIAIYSEVTRNLTGAGSPERVAGLEVTSRYLPLLGIQPILGAGFASNADTAGGDNRVIMLTHGFWRAHFGGDMRVVGSSVSLDQIPHTVIGVLPPNALLDNDAQFLVPVVKDADRRWSRTDGNWSFRVIGRAKPGVAAKQVDLELKAIKQRLVAEYPARAKDWSVAAMPLQTTITSDVRPAFVMLLCTAALVLLIACANVANLLLARGNTRAREMAIRTALGAQPTQLVRLMLTESSLLAFAGCAGSLALALLGISVVQRVVSDLLPHTMRPELDVRVFVFSVCLTCACALLFGLLPSLQACRPNPNRVLKETERGSITGSRQRTQSILIVCEVAFTVVLLVGTGLSIRGLAKLQSTNLGFNPQGTVAFDLSFPTAKYPDASARKRFMEQMESRLKVLPGVQFAGFASTLPLSGKGFGEPLARQGRPADPNYFVGADMISKDFLAAMGMTVLAGRPFTEAEVARDVPNVCVLSEGVVRHLFPGEDPLGKQVVFWGATMEVVGEIQDVHHNGLGGEARAGIYLPGLFPKSPGLSVALRTSVVPFSLVPAVRNVITAMDPDLPMANIHTLDQAVYGATSRWRATLILLGIFAFIAVSLACIGLYGVISYTVGQRHRELSIRMALGAGRGKILQLVLLRGFWLTLVGTVIGIVGALTAGGLFSTQVFGVAPRDLIVTTCAACAMFAVALVGAYLPARRATGLDPASALRND